MDYVRLVSEHALRLSLCQEIWRVSAFASGSSHKVCVGNVSQRSKFPLKKVGFHQRVIHRMRNVEGMHASGRETYPWLYFKPLFMKQQTWPWSFTHMWPVRYTCITYLIVSHFMPIFSSVCEHRKRLTVNLHRFSCIPSKQVHLVHMISGFAFHTTTKKKKKNSVVQYVWNLNMQKRKWVMAPCS